MLQDVEDAARRLQSQPSAQEKSKPAARARSEFKRGYDASETDPISQYSGRSEVKSNGGQRVVSHKWCEVSLKIDRATVVTMSRRGVRDNPINLLTAYSTDRVRRTSTARAGALMFHYPAWLEHHTGGSRSTPTVHPC